MTVRPAPDTMAYVTGLLPVAQGVAVLAALTREADRLRAAGDERSRGQIMADTLVDRVVSPVSADTGSGKELALAIDLVVSDGVLLGASDESAVLMGYGRDPRRAGPGARRAEPVRGHAHHAAAGLRKARDGRTRRHGLPVTQVPHAARPPDRHPGPDVPHPVVRRTSSAPRPRPAGRRRRPDVLHQRPRPRRGVQPRQAVHRLAGQASARASPHGRDDHSDGSPLRDRRTACSHPVVDPDPRRATAGRHHLGCLIRRAIATRPAGGTNRWGTRSQSSKSSMGPSKRQKT